MLATLSAWLLSAVWLPAVLHCTAEAAGTAETSSCCPGEREAAAEADHCDSDHCGVVETGAPRTSSDDRLPVPAMAVGEVWRSGILLPVTDRTSGSRWVAPSPPESAACWRVVERVVPLAQAP